MPSSDSSIKKLISYIFWMFIMPSLIWQVFVYLNDGVDPSKGGDMKPPAEIEKLMKDTMKDADMEAFSGSAAFQGASKEEMKKMNASMHMMGIPAEFEAPKPKKPATNPNVQEYIDEDGIKIRVQMN
ncbi:MAG: hypothetical protein N4A44_00070 [Alphaproteobacteria bacterium]|jgi:hypothetical protein|nr:hypothetical protein [Alphaproteobacteria bacterium]